ncbi:MAG: PAS domain-containing protein [Petrotogales bacterium]
MKDEPDIVGILREEENVNMFQAQNGCEELHISESSSDEMSYETTKDPAPRKGEYVELGTVEEKYRTIFENYAVAITLADKKGRIVSWNKYAEGLLGMDEKELFMKPVSELYPPEEWKKIREENIRQKGIKYRMETKLIRMGEEPFDVEISLCVLRGEKGKTVGSIGIIKDITKQKEMERALHKSDKKFKQLYEKAPIPYHTLSPKGEITDVNETWCRTLGYTKGEVKAKSIFDFVDENERQAAQSSFEEKLRSKKSYIKGRERTYLTKGGDKRIFVIRDFFSFDENNEVNAVYTIMDDVTELKKVEGELKKTELIHESARRLQTIIDTVDEGITLSDKEGHFEIYNSTMHKITGYTMEEANSSRDFTLLLYPDAQERKKALDTLNETIRKGISTDIGTTIQAKDGTKKSLLVSTSIVQIDNRDMFLSVYHDVTKQKKMEEKMKVKDIAIASAVDAIAMVDLEGNLTCVNRSFIKLWGYDNEGEVLGKAATGFWQVEEKAVEVMNALRDEGSWRGELVAKRKDGAFIDVLLSANMVTNEMGEPICMMGSFVDITDRRKMEEELKGKIKELERYKSITVGRELRMIELKNRIKELEKR